MLRRGICAIAFAAPMLALAAGQGCSDEPDIEDLCTWISSQTNCYVQFADDVGAHCAEAWVPGSDPVTDATGAFYDRTDLTTCVRNEGGQIIFDPPLDLSANPMPPFSFIMLDERAAQCGSGSYAGPQTFSITIHPVDTTDAGAATGPDGGALPDNIVGGTFTSIKGEGDSFDLTCPGGQETHHFSSLVLEKCPEHEGDLPLAAFDYSPGIPETDNSAGVAGYARLRVQYPPENPSIPDAEPRVVQYFHCSIPHPPHHCDDGLKNSGETDIDCGGTCASRRRCEDGQSCLEATDCLSGVCSSVQGLLQCVE
jgi:hypothetical protein